jgi:hypothetical protein
MHGKKRTLVAFGAAAIGALGAIFTAFAAGNTQISGSGAFDSAGDCTEIPSQFTMVIDGDLVGCWYTHGWEVVQDTPSGVYAERGTERFIGCLANTTTCGTFDTEYKFTAKYGSDGSEIHGRCQHPITFGTGDFAGITGRVDFKDDVSTGVVYYRGHIKLPNAAGLVDSRSTEMVSAAAPSGCK